MGAVLDRLTRPQTFRKMLMALAGLVVLALVLATVAIVREMGTSSDVTRVERNVFNVTNPSTRQLERGIDRAIRGLTIKQRRVLLDRLLVVASVPQRRRLRVRLRSVQRRAVPAVRVAPRLGNASRLRPTSPALRRSRPKARLKPPPAPVAPVVVPAPQLVAPAPAAVAPDAPGRSDGKPGRKVGQERRGLRP